MGNEKHAHEKDAWKKTKGQFVNFFSQSSFLCALFSESDSPSLANLSHVH